MLSKTTHSKVGRNTWKQFVYKDPFARVPLDTFKSVALASPGWRFVRKESKTYQIHSNFHHLDEFVKEALYDYDEELYESLKGYTKTPDIQRGYHSLLKYCGPPRFKDQIKSPELLQHYERGLEEMRYKFQYCSTLPLPIVMTKIPLNTSAGYSFPGKKKFEVLDQARKKVEGMIHTWKQGGQVDQIPSKMALRGHLSPVKENKTRVVWVSPIENIILENMLFRGFTHQVYKNSQWRNLILSGDNVMSRLTDYLATGAEDSYCNLDISGWDSMRCRFILKDIFYRVLKPNMQLDEPWKEACFEYLVEAFIRTHLILPDGTVISKTTGVPSGSFLTLLINSLAVSLVFTSILKSINAHYRDEKVLGDDFSFKHRYLADPELQSLVKKIADIAFDNFSLVVKPEKVIATNDLFQRKFIGYVVRSGRLHREDRDWFLSALYPESPVKTLSISFTRVYAYLLIGGINSERFRKFYNWFLNGYYDSLKLYDQDLFRQDVMRNSNLRVFKHVFHIDLETFSNFTLDSFLNIKSYKIPFFLTLGSNFLL